MKKGKVIGYAVFVLLLGIAINLIPVFFLNTDSSVQNFRITGNIIGDVDGIGDGGSSSDGSMNLLYLGSEGVESLCSGGTKSVSVNKFAAAAATNSLFSGLGENVGSKAVRLTFEQIKSLESFVEARDSGSETVTITLGSDQILDLCSGGTNSGIENVEASSRVDVAQAFGVDEKITSVELSQISNDLVQVAVKGNLGNKEIRVRFYDKDLIENDFLSEAVVSSKNVWMAVTNLDVNELKNFYGGFEGNNLEVYAVAEFSDSEDSLSTVTGNAVAGEVVTSNIIVVNQDGGFKSSIAGENLALLQVSPNKIYNDVEVMLSLTGSGFDFTTKNVAVKIASGGVFEVVLCNVAGSPCVVESESLIKFTNKVGAAPGTYSVSVINLGDGAESNSLNAVIEGIPKIESISPNPWIINSAVSIAILGSEFGVEPVNFLGIVLYDAEGKFIGNVESSNPLLSWENSGLIQLDMSSDLTEGILKISVVTSAGNTIRESNLESLGISPSSDKPFLIEIIDNGKFHEGEVVPITIKGVNLVGIDTLSIGPNSINLPNNYVEVVDSQTIVLHTPEEFPLAKGKFEIFVKKGNLVSNPINLNVLASRPVIVDISPNPLIISGLPQKVSISGKFFDAIGGLGEVIIEDLDGNPLYAPYTDPKSDLILSSSSKLIELNAPSYLVKGTYPIRIHINDDFGERVSDAVNLVIEENNLNPVITGSSPDPVVVGKAQDVSVSGLRLDGFASINFREVEYVLPDAPVTLVSPELFTLHIPADLPLEDGKLNIFVKKMVSGVLVSSNTWPLILTDGDNDVDGVKNLVDKCPGTVALSKVNVDGCPFFTSIKFDIITDFSNKDLFNLNELLVGIVGLAKIDFGVKNFRLLTDTGNIDPLTGKPIYVAVNLDSLITISEKNKVSVDSISSGLNVPSVITFFSTGLTNPIIYSEGAYCKDCKLDSFNSETKDAVVSVPGFSTYEIKEGICGDAVCGITESCSSCSADCGSCPKGPTGGGGGGGGSTDKKINLDIADLYKVSLNQGGNLLVIFDKKVYVIRLTSILGSSAKFLMVDSNLLAEIAVGGSQQFDVDQDGLRDILITLDSSTSRQVSISVLRLGPGERFGGSTDIVPDTLGVTSTDIAREPSKNYLWWILLVVLVILVLVAILYKRRRDGRVFNEGTWGDRFFKMVLVKIILPLKRYFGRGSTSKQSSSQGTTSKGQVQQGKVSQKSQSSIKSSQSQGKSKGSKPFY